MERLSVEYMGLKLKSPFIAASSGLTAKVTNIIALEHAGAGAVVLKSLFEEQIDNEAEFLNEQSVMYPENMDYLYNYTKQYSVDNYLSLIKESKAAVKIPIIASVNCYGRGSWLEFAKQMQEAGADALEINLYSLPLSKDKTSEEVENEYINIIAALVKECSIPVSVKIGRNFTALPRFVESLKLCGAKSVVLFNKYYHPDIDLETLSVIGGTPFSKEGDYKEELRWIAILSGMVRGIDFSASTGILRGDDAIKMFLVGAKTVQLCSSLYRGGIGEVDVFIKSLISFMSKHGYTSLDDFRGKLNYSTIQSPEKYERVQFMKTFGSQK